MDLREYIERLKAEGELLEVETEVDWNLEAAAISAMNGRIGGPALLFRKVKGYPEGYRLAGNLFGGRKGREWIRYAIALGLDPGISYEEFIGEYLRRLGAPIKPMVVDQGPCKEEIHLGKDVNLFEFPWPYLHQGDGGRYGTIQSVITKDYYSDWVNWGNYRAMVHTKNKLGVLLSRGQQCAYQFYEHWEPNNTPMPFCIAIGGDPVYFMAACSYSPEGVNEVDVAGGLRQAPIQLVKAETNDLYVPADCEIVIEGEVRPGERMDEGPFGEYFGFVHGPRQPMPVFRVTAITHRRNPIFPFVCEGVRGTDGNTVCSVLWSIALYAALRFLLGYPVTGVFLPLETPYSAPVVAVERGKADPGAVAEMAAYMQQLGPFGHIDHEIFVDGHVKPWEVGAWLREVALKADPVKGIHVSAPNMWKVTLNVYQTPEELRAGMGSKIFIDATTGKQEVPQVVTLRDLYPGDVLEVFSKGGGR